MITFVSNRHNELSIISSNLRKNTLVDKIDLIDSKISFIKAKQLDNNLLKRTEIEDRIAKLKAQLPIINLEINQLEKVIIDDTNNLSLLIKNDKNTSKSLYFSNFRTDNFLLQKQNQPS